MTTDQQGRKLNEVQELSRHHQEGGERQKSHNNTCTRSKTFKIKHKVKQKHIRGVQKQECQ